MKSRFCGLALALCGLAAGCMDEAPDSATDTKESLGARIQYSYDPLGRLIQAESSDGAVHYSYDAVGNITSIRRLGSGSLALIDFAPKTAAIGATVTVFGSGFNATPAANTVAFNGAAAIVSTASSTSLTVTVPAGATSGKISVHDSLGTALSSDDFMVMGMSPEPTITSFAPTVAGPGSVVAITGTNFQSAPQDDKVELGGAPASVVQDATTPNATTLKFSVPAATASGVIAVTTPFGTATSTSMLIVVPTGVTPGDVEVSGALAVNAAPTTVTTTVAGKKAAFTFPGTTGQGLHLRTQAGTFAAGITANVYDPSGTLVETLSLGNNGVADFTKRLATTGNYVAVLNPATTDKGSIQLTVLGDVEQAAVLDTATPLNLAIGQNARLSFTGQAGHGYGLALSAVTLSTGSGSITMTLRKADNTALGGCSAASTGGSCDFDANLFATTGMYYVDLDPSGLNAATFTTTLSNDVTGSLTPDAAATVVTLARAGQNATYTFNGKAGQLVTVVLSGNALDDGNAVTNNQTNLQVFKPSSPYVSAVGSTTLATNVTGTTLDLMLPETGSYRVRLNPSALDKGTVNLQLRSYATSALTLETSTPVSLAAGQNARYSFTATAGSGYGLALSTLTYTPSGGSMSVSLRKADGTLLTSCSFGSSNSCNFSPIYFTTSGTYLVDVDPQGLAATSFTLSISADPVAPITLDASAVTATIVRPGQNARYTFTGTVGQLVTVVLTGNTLDDGNATTTSQTQLALYKPSSAVTALASTSLQTNVAGTTLDATLPEAGTYTIFLDPISVDTGTIGVTLKSYLTGSITLGTAVGVSLSAGRNARYSFPGTASTLRHLTITNLAFTPTGGSLTAYLRKADGTQIYSCGFSAGASAGCDFPASVFATTGTYYVDFDPTGLNAASFGALLQ